MERWSLACVVSGADIRTFHWRCFCDAAEAVVAWRAILARPQRALLSTDGAFGVGTCDYGANLVLGDGGWHNARHCRFAVFPFLSVDGSVQLGAGARRDGLLG